MNENNSVVRVPETQKGGSESGSANISTIVATCSSGSANTRSLVDFEGFQPVVNRKKKHEFFRQTLSIEKINEYYDKQEQELMDLLSGTENK